MANETPNRFPLAVTPDNRDATTLKDAKLVNGYLEKYAEGYRVIKRPGLVEVPSLAVTAGTGNGMFSWATDIYQIVGTTLYINGLTPTALGVDYPRFYWFTSTHGADPMLVFGNGIYYYSYSHFGGLAALAGGAAPGGLGSYSGLPGLAYLDGTTYYAAAAVYGGTSIYGSGINDVTTWSVANQIQAIIESDGVQLLAKQLVYVLAYKQWTTEVFYDAGNPAGSPLGNVQGALMTCGCASARSFRDIDGVHYLLSSTREGALQVIAVEGLKPRVISDARIEALLVGADTVNVYSWSHKGNGHCFYVLTLVSANLTLVYDIKERSWSQWTDANGNYLPIVTSTYSYPLKSVSESANYLQHESNGKVYTLSDTAYTDAGSVITVDLYTPNFDAGIDRRKALNAMRFNADQTQGSILQVRCNDYDYDATKWTNFRQVDLGKQRPYLSGCGTFYRRALHIRHQCNTPLRLTSVDLQLDVGTL